MKKLYKRLYQTEYIYRFDPVPGVHRRTYKRWRHSRIRHLVMEILHEDYIVYNRARRKQEIEYELQPFDGPIHLNAKHSSWKEKKIRHQYLKNKRD